MNNLPRANNFNFDIIFYILAGTICYSHANALLQIANDCDKANNIANCCYLYTIFRGILVYYFVICVIFDIYLFYFGVRNEMILSMFKFLYSSTMLLYRTYLNVIVYR